MTRFSRAVPSCPGYEAPDQIGRQLHPENGHTLAPIGMAPETTKLTRPRRPVGQSPSGATASGARSPRAPCPLGSRVMKDEAHHGRPGSSRDLLPVEALRAGLGLRAGYRIVHDRPAAEASAGRAGNRSRPGRRGAISGASRLRGGGLRRRPRCLHAGRGLGLRGTRTRVPRSRLLAGARPRRGRTYSASMLRALVRGTRESDDALRSAGSWPT